MLGSVVSVFHMYKTVKLASRMQKSTGLSRQELQRFYGLGIVLVAVNVLCCTARRGHPTTLGQFFGPIDATLLEGITWVIVFSICTSVPLICLVLATMLRMKAILGRAHTAGSRPSWRRPSWRRPSWRRPSFTSPAAHESHRGYKDLVKFNSLNVLIFLIEVVPGLVSFTWAFAAPETTPDGLTMLGGWLMKLSCFVDSLFLYRYTYRSINKAVRTRRLSSKASVVPSATSTATKTPGDTG